MDISARASSLSDKPQYGRLGAGTYYTLGTAASNNVNASFNGNGTVTELFGAEGETPLSAALPLFASGLGALGLFGWRRKRKAQAAA